MLILKKKKKVYYAVLAKEFRPKDNPNGIVAVKVLHPNAKFLIEQDLSHFFFFFFFFIFLL